MTISHETSHLLHNDRRLRILNELSLLKTDHTESFDRMTRIASHMLDAPVSLATMVADDHQFFVRMTGLQAQPYAETRTTPLSHSFCQYVVASDEPLVINDAREDDTLKTNLAIPDLGVIGYLGIPIYTSEGDVIGSFCVITHEPRTWTSHDLKMLTELTEIVITQVEHLIDARARHLAEAEREQFKALRLISHQLANALLAPSTSIQMKVALLERTSRDDKVLRRLTQTQQHLDTVRFLLREFIEIASADVKIDETLDAKPIIRSAVYALESNNPHVQDASLAECILDAPNHTVRANAQLLRFALRTLLNYIVTYNQTTETITLRSYNKASKLKLAFIFPYHRDKNSDHAQQIEIELVKQIIVALRGSFKIVQKPDATTSVIISLPLAA